MKTIKEIREAIKNEKANSAWNRAVKEYALELIEEMPEDKEFFGNPADKKELLNGAQDWHWYSWGGCSLIYDKQIAARLCTLTELKKTHNGERQPNPREEWLDVQARALFQAAQMILRIVRAE